MYLYSFGLPKQLEVYELNPIQLFIAITLLNASCSAFLFARSSSSDSGTTFGLTSSSSSTLAFLSKPYMMKQLVHTGRERLIRTRLIRSST